MFLLDSMFYNVINFFIKTQLFGILCIVNVFIKYFVVIDRLPQKLQVSEKSAEECHSEMLEGIFYLRMTKPFWGLRGAKLFSMFIMESLLL